MTRLFGHTVQFPDLAYVAWEKMPGGRIPTKPMIDLVPDFVIEVLSEGNTHGEMSRKRREYFHAGVELLWMVDHRSRTVTVFTTPTNGTVFTEGQILNCGRVLPGWKVDIADLFSRRPYERPHTPASPCASLPRARTEPDVSCLIGRLREFVLASSLDIGTTRIVGTIEKRQLPEARCF
jgi:hypothetical protein